MSAPEEVLTRLVGGVVAFGEQYWGRSTYGHRDAAGFDDVLTVGDVDALVADGLRRPSVRMVRDGKPLPASSYCSPTRLGGELLDDVVSADKVAAEFRSGATLVLQSLHRHWRPAAVLAARLADEIGHRVQVNAYLSPPGSAGLSAHTDSHDVFVLQAAGRKTWWIEGTGELELTAGDVRYVPQGVRHAASTGSAMSLHLTVGVLSTTRRDLLARFVRDVTDLDVPLPLGFHRDIAGTASALGDAIAETLDATGRCNAAEWAATYLARRRLADPPLARHGELLRVVEAGAIDADSRIAWVDPRAFLDVSGPRVRLDLGSRSLWIPSAMVSAVELLSSTDRSIRVGDLPGLDDASCVVVARRLVAEGACEVRDADATDPRQSTWTTESSPP